MRFWSPPELCDILVSELLGSIVDNELSPECIDGAQRVMKTNAISIPESYTSFLAPLSSSSLYQKAKAYNDQKHLETPFVVYFRDVYIVSKPQPVWDFQHPNKIEMNPLGHSDFNIHNTRYSQKTFKILQDSVIHGMAAYFESVLYQDVIISINPETHSPDMTSWFPMYFPLKSPLFIPANSDIELHIWRLTDSRKVWYEWSAIALIDGQRIVSDSSAIHNKDGESSWIGL
jgi:protein arginine N-methyltransferase 5